MSETVLVGTVALLGWLVLAGSALASHRFGWGKGIRYALVWAAIFAGAFLIVEAIA